MKSQKPIQYQQGWTEFYKLRINFTEDVLIPRPESELLVDEVLAIAKQSNHLSIIDVGTGSGCIAISIAKNLPNVKIIATDISKKALKVAQANAKNHGVDKQISFVRADLLNPITDKNLALHSRCANMSLTRGPDLIVANLPYIPTSRIPYLDASVKDFEPRMALDGGKDGFGLYRKLFEQISLQPRRLQPKFMVCEIDYTHGELAVNEALKFFPQAEAQVKKDLAKKQRFLVIKF